MKMVGIVSSALVIFVLNGCGGADASGTATQAPSSLEEETPYINNGNIPSIIPSSQSSDEIINLVANAPELPYETIDPNIKLSIGYGGIKQGVDANGKRVFLMGTHKKSYEEHNMFFCHESDGACTKLVDNTAEQHLGSTGLFYDGKIWINTLDKTVDPNGSFGGALNYYDVNTRVFKKRALKMLEINGETHSMSLGSDKQLYFSGSNFESSPHYATVAMVNPKNLNEYKVYKNYFTQAPVDRSRSVAADDEYIYQVVGDSPFYLIAINKDSGVGTKLKESVDGKVIQLEDGVSFQYTKNGVRTYSYLYKGVLEAEADNIDKLSCPWAAGKPANHGSGYWPQKGNYYLEYNTSGYANASYSVQNMPTTSQNASGARPFNFTATVEGRDISFTISDIDLYPQTVTRITTLSNGDMLVRGVGYAGISRLNTLTDTAKYIGSPGISPSVLDEFYDYSKNKLQVMFEGYPSTAAIIYNPDEYISNANTQNLGYLRKIKDMNCVVDCENKDIGTHRALEMEQINESLYFAGMQYRTGVSGALIWYNTRTQAKKAISQGIFDNYQTRSLLSINGKLIIGTQTVDNRAFGGKARPSTAKIFVFDPISEKIVKEYTPLEGLDSIDVGRIDSIDGRHIIGISNDQAFNGNPGATKTFLYIIDTYTDEVVMKKTINIKNNMLVLPEGSARNRNYDFVKHGDYIYTYLSSRTLIRIDRNGKIEALSNLPYQARFRIFNNNAYFTLGENIIKINNIN